MNQSIILVILTSNIFLLYSAKKRQAGFPYYFIFISAVSNILLTPLTASFPGIAFLSRIILFSSLGLYIYRANIKIDSIIKFFIFYFLFLIVLHPDRRALGEILSYLSIFLMFALGASIKNDKFFYEMLMKTCKVLIVFFVIYLMITTATGFGKDMYGGFTVGGLSDRRVSFISFVSVLLFGALYTKSSLSLYEYLYIVIGLLILLLITKRLGLLLFFMGCSVFLLQSKISMKRLMSLIMVTAFFYLLVTVYFLPKIDKRLENRGRRMESNFATIQREARYQEYSCLPAYLKDNPINVIMFGNGFAPTFNYRYTYLGLHGRSIHTGFIHTLYTTGLVGTIFIVIFSIKLIYAFFISSARYKRNKNNIISSTILFGFPSICMFILSYVVDNVFKDFSLFIVFFVLGVAYRHIGSKNNNNSRISKNLLKKRIKASIL